MNKPIPAVLTKEISFIDFYGNLKTIPKGQTVQVVKIQTQIVRLNTDGKGNLELVGDFVGSIGKDSFDLDRTEFKTVD